jgi:hypothetical protein
LPRRLSRRQHFVFVEHVAIPTDNDAVERAIRPYVVLRNVNGGTRSGKGSKLPAIPLSLFGTWVLRGQEALRSCQEMLRKGASLAPV